MIEYIPWWLTAGGLAAVTLGFWLIVGKPLGISGSWAKVIKWRNDQEVRQAEQAFTSNPDLLMDALMMATIEEFGQEAVEQSLAARSHTSEAVASRAEVTVIERVPWTVHLIFLVATMVGGMISSIWMTGGIALSNDLGELHRQIFGNGFPYILSLFAGGMLIGFGTQMGGGCTSGHGLSGVSRLIPASMVATFVFFGTAVVVSLLLKFS